MSPAGNPGPDASPTLPPTNPPDAAQESKGERTRRRLLELAVDHFGRKGFRATSVSEITREAGLTQAASYAYFESKLDLFRQAVDRDVVTLLEGVVARLEETPVRQLLANAMVLLVAAVDEHPLARRVLAGQEPEGAGQLRDLPALIEVRRRLAERLADGQADGAVRPDIDPAVVAAGLQAVLLGLLVSLVITQDPEQPQAAPSPDLTLGVLAVFDAVLVAPPPDHR